MPSDSSRVGALTLFASLVLLAAGLGTSQAQAQAPMQSHGYQVLIDHDADPGTGCSLAPTGGSALSGFEHRLRATVEVTAGGAELTSVERQDCADGTFGAGVSVSLPTAPPWPAGLDAGVSGADAIELGVPLDFIAPTEGSLLRLVFIADDGAGSDVLATVDGTGGGAAIELGLPGDPVGIPVLSLGGLMLMLLTVTVLGLLAHRRLGRIGAVSAVLLVAGTAWALNFVLDGNLGDWDGVAPAGQDATGDAVGGDDGNDLVAGFAAIEGGAAYFRVDVVDVENGEPTADADAWSVAEDTTLNVAAPGVLGNDSDADADPLTAVLDAGPENAASFALNADGSFDYTPAADFNGTDTFTYVANDGLSDSPPATVTITVDPVNDAPVADEGSASTDEDTPVTITLSGSDLDGDALTFSVASGPSDGSLGAIAQLTPTTAEVTYTPGADFNGRDAFTFAASDGALDSPAATVAITVNPVNDPPVNRTPGSQTVLEDRVLSFSPANGNAISISDVDAGTGNIETTLSVDAGTLQASAVGGATLLGNGTDFLTIIGTLADINATLDGLSYQPAGDSATLTITTSDQGNSGAGGSLSDTDTADISVVPVNERPSIALDGTTIVGPGIPGIEGTTSFSFGAATGIVVPYLFGDPEGSADCSGSPCFEDLWYELRFVSVPEFTAEPAPFTYLSPFDRSEDIDPANKNIQLPNFDTGDLGHVQWRSSLELANDVLDNYSIRFNYAGEYVLEIIVLDNGRSGACPAGIEIPPPDPALDPEGIRSTVGRNGDLVGDDPVRCLRESSVRITLDVPTAESVLTFQSAPAP